MPYKPGRVRRKGNIIVTSPESGSKGDRKYADYEPGGNGQVTGEQFAQMITGRLMGLPDGERLNVAGLLNDKIIIGDANQLPFDKLDFTGANLSSCCISLGNREKIHGTPAEPPASWRENVLERPRKTEAKSR